MDNIAILINFKFKSDSEKTNTGHCFHKPRTQKIEVYKNEYPDRVRAICNTEYFF